MQNLETISKLRSVGCSSYIVYETCIRDAGISILHATDTRYINYNLISRHVSVLATTSSPSGSILARANNPIKIEKLNCDDPIRATKRAPFLIRPRAADDIAKIFRVYAKRVYAAMYILS